MFILNRLTSAAIYCSLSLTFLTGQILNAQAQDLVIEDEFDASLVVVSLNNAAASHQASNLAFGQTSSLNSNVDFIPNLTLTTSEEKVTSNNYNLVFNFTTGTEAGFIPPGTTLGAELINQWTFDIGNTFLNSNNGVNFSSPVIYNSATGSWFDNGNLVFTTSYLSQLNVDSTSTELRGQFEIALRSGDLGAFGNGIDTFTLTVNVQSIPEPITLLGTGTALLLGVFFKRKLA